MENTENTSQAMHLLAEAHRAWERMRPLREKRERNKNYTYGNQWCDMMTDEHGRRVSEWQHLRDNGKDPLTNNLIRQLVKSVVGRFRSRLAAEPAPAEPLHGNLVGELDSRLMEEFLISGCCFQRIDFGEEDCGMVLSGRYGCLDTDMKHQQIVDSEGDAGASPAVFVYTLPNVAAGEVSIRHHIKGENTWFWSDDRQMRDIRQYAGMMMAAQDLKYCIIGYFDSIAGKYEAVFKLLERQN